MEDGYPNIILVWQEFSNNGLVKNKNRDQLNSIVQFLFLLEQFSIEIERRLHELQIVPDGCLLKILTRYNKFHSHPDIPSYENNS